MAGYRFDEVRLATSKLVELRSFYSGTLGLTCTDQEQAFTIHVGSTKLTFYSVSQGEPTYHFAFNISENKLGNAKAWLSDRVNLVLNGKGEAIYHFESWNAHAMYFIDPVGNIGEFIARHDLGNSGEGGFGVGDVLSLSEIGFVVDDVSGTCRKLEERFGLDPYKAGSDEFQPMGNEECLLIVARTGREWFASEGGRAAIFPIEVKLIGDREAEWFFDNEPYSIKMKRG